RQGKRLKARDISIENAETPGYVAEALGVRRGVKAPLVQRTLVADNAAVAHMRDILHPDIPLPPSDELRSALEPGEVLPDFLGEHGIPIAFARTHVNPRLIEPGTKVGQALNATRVTATLELVETLHTTDGKAVQYSTQVFWPGAIDLHVMRSLKASSDGEQ